MLLAKNIDSKQPFLETIVLKVSLKAETVSIPDSEKLVTFGFEVYLLVLSMQYLFLFGIWDNLELSAEGIVLQGPNCGSRQRIKQGLY